MSEDEVRDDMENKDEDEMAEEVLTEPSGSRLSRFLDDPWPTATFFLMILGFVIVLFTPYNVWSQWHWMLVGLYFMWVLVTIGFVFSMQTWRKSGGSKIRFAAIAVLIVILAVGVLGSVDLGLWILLAAPIFPGLETPLLYGTNAIVVFCLYSLWLLQRATNPDRT
jgi:hypothetical protein